MNIEQLKKSGWVVLEVISGSHAYGTNVEGSDIDKKGIYIQPTVETFANYAPQISDDKNDTTYYEIGRFIELLSVGNPNVMEILDTPEDCVIYKDEYFDEIFTPEVKKKFLTSKLRHTFTGFAYSQIRKSKGLNKKVNWDENKVKRRDVLDFCYVLGDKEESYPFKHFSRKKGGYMSENIGLSKVNNFPDAYSMYYLEEGGGITNEKSNDVQLRNIPKNARHLGYLRFDKNGYSQHCKDYKSYQTWLKERNEVRYDHIKEHGQKYDGKNLLHTLRLLNMAKDIADGKGIVVRRPKEECEYLVKVRKGQVDLEEIYLKAEYSIEKIKESFDRVDLPKEVPAKFRKQLITKIRIDNYERTKTPNCTSR